MDEIAEGMFQSTSSQTRERNSLNCATINSVWGFNPLPLKQEEETQRRPASFQLSWFQSTSSQTRGRNIDLGFKNKQQYVSIHFLSNKRKKQRLNRVENNVL
ncbi:hypothetical protein LEP1GSC074_2256 [Leptospira noguchii str. Hook]|nr:hypothetical protein LEP1GSC074_2256 [Leptospira noguchii str. Hook]